VSAFFVSVLILTLLSWNSPLDFVKFDSYFNSFSFIPQKRHSRASLFISSCPSPRRFPVVVPGLSSSTKKGHCTSKTLFPLLNSFVPVSEQKMVAFFLLGEFLDSPGAFSLRSVAYMSLF
jgi:hypothetical protein